MSQKQIPEVYVHKISMWKNGNIRIFVKCCYCKTEHSHGPGIKDVTFTSTTDFGKRISHCLPGGEYKLSMALWGDTDFGVDSSGSSSDNDLVKVSLASSK